MVSDRMRAEFENARDRQAQVPPFARPVTTKPIRPVPVPGDTDRPTDDEIVLTRHVSRLHGGGSSASWHAHSPTRPDDEQVFPLPAEQLTVVPAARLTAAEDARFDLVDQVVARDLTIRDLRAEVAALRAKLDAAEALHRDSRGIGWCDACDLRWPCATVRALSSVPPSTEDVQP